MLECAKCQLEVEEKPQSGFCPHCLNDKFKRIKCEGCDDPECVDCCEHQEHDHGVCSDCGEDITDQLVCDAEYAYEGDR